LTRAAEAARVLTAAVEQRRDEHLELLEQLVGIESHATQPDGVRRVGAAVAAELEQAGFACETVPGRTLAGEDAWLTELMLPGHDYGTVAEVVVARREGAGPAVLLLGDLDTSYTAGALERFPYRLEDGRAYGPGVADMKAGLVLIAAAVRALAESGLAAPTICVVLSPEEQAGSLRSRGVIEELAAQYDWCLCVECARDGGNVLTTRAQVGVGRLDVEGREAHAGSGHANGASAILDLAAKVIAIEALTDPARAIYVTVSEIRGGRRRSVVPGHAYCTIDIRTPGEAEWEATVAALETIAARVDVPGTTATLRTHSHRPAVAHVAEPLLEAARRAGAELSLSFGTQHSAGAGSSAFPAGLGVPTLDGLGPPGGDLMTDREYVEVEGIFERAALLALTLHLLAAAPEGGREQRLVLSRQRSMD
jgi:glutamate carboxypeptidase